MSGCNGKDIDNIHVLYVRLRTKFVRICTLFVLENILYMADS